MNTSSPSLSTRETIKLMATMGLLFSVLFYYAYWAWATGLLDHPLGDLTLGLPLLADLSVLL